MQLCLFFIFLAVNTAKRQVVEQRRNLKLIRGMAKNPKTVDSAQLRDQNTLTVTDVKHNKNQTLVQTTTKQNSHLVTVNSKKSQKKKDRDGAEPIAKRLRTDTTNCATPKPRPSKQGIASPSRTKAKATPIDPQETADDTLDKDTGVHITVGELCT